MFRRIYVDDKIATTAHDLCPRLPRKSTIFQLLCIFLKGSSNRCIGVVWAVGLEVMLDKMCTGCGVRVSEDELLDVWEC
jgi:hypothetical protein